MQENQAEDQRAVMGHLVAAQFLGDAPECGAFVRLFFQITEHEKPDIRHRCLQGFVFGYEHGAEESLVFVGIWKDVAAEEFVGKQVSDSGHIRIAAAPVGFPQETVRESGERVFCVVGMFLKQVQTVAP